MTSPVARAAGPRHDALLLISFGGPEGPDDVLPFLRNVTRGRGIPDERLEAVAGHYRQFGGVSPINAQNRALLAALREAVELPVYWGNRNWAPYLPETLAAMRADGISRALAFVTSAEASYSGCRQYREDIARAQAEIGVGAPLVDKLRVYYNHPGFVQPFVEATLAALDRLPADARDGARLVFTAHSVPLAMAAGSPYVPQLQDAAGLVAAAVRAATGVEHPWQLAWQSRSGPPSVPWLEPDVGEVLAEAAATGAAGAVVVPIGFVSDHLEVVYDLDVEAVPAARATGLPCERAATPGVHPRFVAMVAELVAERTGWAPRRSVGSRGPSHDGCPRTCCLSGRPAAG